MASLLEFKFILDGWSGGPGVNTMFTTKPANLGAEDVQTLNAMFQDVYTSFLTFFAGGVTVTSQSWVKELDVETGNLVSLTSVDSPWTITAPGGPDAVPRFTMAKAQFVTDHIVNNRLLRGGVFLGPLGDNAYDSDGSLRGDLITAVSGAWDGFLDDVWSLAVQLAVWHRPKAGQGGAFGHVQAVGCNGLPAVLRGRRD